MVKAGKTQDLVEKIAEIMFDYDKEQNNWYWYWPLHENDDGYRGDGAYVHIVPIDIALAFREKASVILNSCDFKSHLASFYSVDIESLKKKPISPSHPDLYPLYEAHRKGYNQAIDEMSQAGLLSHPKLYPAGDAKAALKIFDDNFDIFEETIYMRGEEEQGRENKAVYKFWPEDEQKIRTALSTPKQEPVNTKPTAMKGELAKIIAELPRYSDELQRSKGYLSGGMCANLMHDIRKMAALIETASIE